MKKFLLLSFILFASKAFAQKHFIDQDSNSVYTYSRDSIRLTLIYHPKKNIGILEIQQQENNHWEALQQFNSLSFQFPNIQPEWKDFNQDGASDFKLYYGSEGRGANVLYHVFIWNKTLKKYQWIKNASEIPNIHINNQQQWEGIFVTGSVNFLQYKLENNHLLPISQQHAYINQANTHTVIAYFLPDSIGEMILIKKDSIAEIEPIPDIPPLYPSFSRPKKNP